MGLFYAIIFFIFGTTFGSFYNVVGLRSPKNETFINDRSYCPTCKKSLVWYELIPILSFLLQRGKCRNCKERISSVYPIVESLTGILFAWSFLHIGWEWELLTALLLVSMLMIILVSDIRYMIIQNRVLLFFLSLFILMRIVVPLEPWWSPVAGAAVAMLLLAVIIMITRGGMGAGDMKLFGVLGIVLGMQNVLLAFFLACLLGAGVGILLMAFNVIKRKQPVPFGPYIVAGSLLAYFYGDSIIGWYLKLIL